MLNSLIGIENADKYNIKELKAAYYSKNKDIFANLVNAYNYINRYLQENQQLIGYAYNPITEGDVQNEYYLINCILEDFSTTKKSTESKENTVKEDNIYLYLDFEQYIGDPIMSLKEIKEKWNLYSEDEKKSITDIAKKKFDTRIWVLKEAVDVAINNTNKDKIDYEKNNDDKNGEDIDI